jgi:hypothetical protein
MVPVGAGDKSAVIEQINAINPKGETPITKSFEVASERLKGVEEETTVVLISDGKETCEGDPCALVRSLREQGINVRVHVVGFDVNQEERDQLVCIAGAGEGKYFSADNAEQLTVALTKVKHEITAVKDPQPKPEPQPSHEPVERTIKLGTGTIVIENHKPESDRSMRALKLPVAGETKVFILNQETGKEIARCHFFNKQLAESCLSPQRVTAGTYTVKFSNLDLKNIEVAPNQDVVINAGDFFGWVRLRNHKKGLVKFVNQASGEVAGKCKAKTCANRTQLPAGTYTLEFPTFEVEGIEIPAGQDINIE